MVGLVSRAPCFIATLALGCGLICGLSCGEAAPQPTTQANADPAAAALVDEALLAELLGEAVEVEGDRVSADALLVRLAFEPLIRGTGPAGLQRVQSQGYRLTGVAEREPLWQLGLRDGDVLTRVDGQPILAREHELRSQWEARPGQVELTYLRGQETRVLKLRIRPGATWKGSGPTTEALDERLDLPAAPSPEPPDFVAEISQGMRCTPSTHDADPSIGRCELQRSAMDQLLANPSALAKQMRIVPGVKDGQTVGFKLYGIRSSSIPAQLGFKNGDLILTINDLPLSSMDAAMQTYTKLRTASELAITLERKGEIRRLNVVFVDALGSAE